MGEDRSRNERHGDGFTGPGGHSANLEAQRPSEKHGDGSKGPGGHSANLEVIFAGL